VFLLPFPCFQALACRLLPPFCVALPVLPCTYFHFIKGVAGASWQELELEKMTMAMALGLQSSAFAFFNSLFLAFASFFGVVLQ
jgi:hypothetical protein